LAALGFGLEFFEKARGKKSGNSPTKRKNFERDATGSRICTNLRLSKHGTTNASALSSLLISANQRRLVFRFLDAFDSAHPLASLVVGAKSAFTFPCLEMRAVSLSITTQKKEKHEIDSEFFLEFVVSRPSARRWKLPKSEQGGGLPSGKTGSGLDI